MNVFTQALSNVKAVCVQQVLHYQNGLDVARARAREGRVPGVGVNDRGKIVTKANPQQHLRFVILETLHAATPIGAYDLVVLHVVQAAYPTLTLETLRHELDYLYHCGLIDLDRLPRGKWIVELAVPWEGILIY